MLHQTVIFMSVFWFSCSVLSFTGQPRKTQTADFSHVHLLWGEASKAPAGAPWSLRQRADQTPGTHVERAARQEEGRLAVPSFTRALQNQQPPQASGNSRWVFVPMLLFCFRRNINGLKSSWKQSRWRRRRRTAAVCQTPPRLRKKSGSRASSETTWPGSRYAGTSAGMC